jgi:hypothetical protein
MPRSGMKLAERMKLRRPRRPKDPVPRVGAKSQDAGKRSFQVAKSYGAQQRS